MRTIGLRFASACLVLAMLSGAPWAAFADETKPSETPPPTAAPAPAPSTPAPANPPGPGTPNAVNKVEACKQSAKDKGLKGWDMLDDAQICVAEARLDCVKQAVAAKARGPKRPEFMKTCMGIP